jgi:His/Glu/Gln/Arg/opine family amino acid ABC transporter permease subunit
MSTYHFDYRFVWRSLPVFLQGLVITVKMSIIASVAAVIWGIVLLMLRKSRWSWCNIPARAYIDFVRNVPILVQMYFIYFAFPSLGLAFSPFVCGVLALTIQNGGYLAEIYRGGVEAISTAQYESGLSLGMRRLLIMRKIILPQALRSVIPPAVNQLIALLKDTSLASSISVLEMTQVAKLLTERTAASYEVFIVLAILYIILTSLLSLALNLYETRVRVVR